MYQDTIEKLAFTRQIELANDPNTIKQTFDVNHLKSIHAYLFQDSKKERNAGSFRPAKYDVHSKNRSATYSIRKPFYYEPLPDENNIDNIIKQANKELTSLKLPNQKVNILSNLYIELDYQHPFVEGNSRTIRIFLEHIAQKHGIELDWRSTAQNKDEFYRARDFEIAKKNTKIKPTNDIETYMLEEAKRYNTQDYIASQIAMHNGRYLNQIIKDCSNYPNKELLDKMNSSQIKKYYPNISDKDAKTIEAFTNYQLSQYENPVAQQAILQKIHSQLADVESGKITLPNPPELTKDKGRER